MRVVKYVFRQLLEVRTRKAPLCFFVLDCPFEMLWIGYSHKIAAWYTAVLLFVLSCGVHKHTLEVLRRHAGCRREAAGEGGGTNVVARNRDFGGRCSTLPGMSYHTPVPGSSSCCLLPAQQGVHAWGG